ncbi:MAG: homocysteine S-methyltransferase family protein [Deltaproteobacteria bacterium]|nr:homocysteine S-methyltransferase family protein [Deltaproteobacteria bacterium]
MNLQKLLRSEGLIILDGAMGTELDKMGNYTRCENNVSNPGNVMQVHKNYIRAGSMAIITNTCTMNRIFIETHKLNIDTTAVNLAGTKIAREAIGEAGFVLGDISATGQMLEPYGNFTEEAFFEAYAEQAGVLNQGGVDGFIIETMFDLREAICALKACKKVSDKPVLVSISYNTEEEGGRTIMGNSAKECAMVLSDEGADAIGANCGNIGPFEMAKIVQIIASNTRLPVIAKPNAGKPKLIDGKTIFDMSPMEFSDGLSQCIEAGAKILGGCCGTTPEYIRTFSKNMVEVTE